MGFILRLEEIGGPLAIFDRSGVLIAASPPAQTLLGSISEGAELPDSLRTSIVESRLGEPFEWDETQRDTGVCLGITRYPLGAELYVALMREITEKRRTLTSRLYRQRLVAVGSIVGDVAHDFRNVLATIVYNTDVLRDIIERPAQAEERAECLDEIDRGARRLTELIGNLVDYARTDVPSRGEVLVIEVAGRVTSLVRPLTRHSRHELVTSVARDARVVWGNPVVVEQILINLVTNSIEAASEPLHISIESTRSSCGERVEIRVRDTGPGIPREHRRRIFQPFFTTRADALGTGLSLAREAAASLDGRLYLEPADEGACFVVELPAKAPVEAPRE